MVKLRTGRFNFRPTIEGLDQRIVPAADFTTANVGAASTFNDDMIDVSESEDFASWTVDVAPTMTMAKQAVSDKDHILEQARQIVENTLVGGGFNVWLIQGIEKAEATQTGDQITATFTLGFGVLGKDSPNHATVTMKLHYNGTFIGNAMRYTLNSTESSGYTGWFGAELHQALFDAASSESIWSPNAYFDIDAFAANARQQANEFMESFFHRDRDVSLVSKTRIEGGVQLYIGGLGKLDFQYNRANGTMSLVRVEEYDWYMGAARGVVVTPGLAEGLKGVNWTASLPARFDVLGTGRFADEIMSHVKNQPSTSRYGRGGATEIDISQIVRTNSGVSIQISLARQMTYNQDPSVQNDVTATLSLNIRYDGVVNGQHTFTVSGVSISDPVTRGEHQRVDYGHDAFGVSVASLVARFVGTQFTMSV